MDIKKKAYEAPTREARTFEEVMWRWLKKGAPREEALHRAHEWERNQKKPFKGRQHEQG